MSAEGRVQHTFRRQHYVDRHFVLKLTGGLGKYVTIIVIDFEAAGPTVSAKKTEAMLLQTQDLASGVPPSVIKAAEQRCRLNRKRSFHTSAALSTKALTSWLRSSDRSES